MIIGFEGQTAIVTGAGHGIGRAIAQGLCRPRGTRFTCWTSTPRVLPRRCGCAVRNCHSAVVDVGDRAAVQKVVAGIEAASGRIDILVNNAGGVCGQTGRPIEEISADDWHAIFNVNLTGTFMMSQAVAPAMKRAKRGRIVNISSGAGRSISLTGIQAYASAKAGQIGLTRQLAHELGAWNITVNCVAPGFILSNPTTERQYEAMGEDGKAKLLGGDRAAPAWRARGYRQCGDVLLLGSCWVDHRRNSWRGRRQMNAIEGWLADYAPQALDTLKAFLSDRKRVHRSGLQGRD